MQKFIWKYLRNFLPIIFLFGLLIGCTGPETTLHLGSLTQQHPPRPMIAPPHNIALLLPMSGDFAASSKAIHDGFLATYYANKQDQPDIHVDIIDTSGKDIVSTYNEAVNNGADLIVGPLTKQEVAAIANMGSLPVPTLALNTLDNHHNQIVVNLYQFGLPPQDEAYQAAAKIHNDGYPRVAVIAPDNQWGQRIASAFTSQYTSVGGQVVANMKFTKGTDFAAEIQDLLQIDPDQAQNRGKHSATIAFQHREDVDAIFLVAYPPQAAQIVPLLKFYYASTPPIYSISAINSGSFTPEIQQDLSGVMYCDMPWTAQNPDALPQNLQDLRAKIATLWPESNTTNRRLYALGIDAYNIAVSFDKLLNMPNVAVRSATGAITLDNYNHIVRSLAWEKI